MNRQLQRRSAPQPWAGFTLVELLVVIVIIAILVGLLIPVLGMARSAVQEATIKAEVASLAQAMEAFKTQYQTDYPPDFAGQDDPARINEFMSRISRYRNEGTDLPRDPRTGKPTANITFFDLDPAEALYFWLSGFSDDTTHPLYGPLGTAPEAVQRTPLFDFDKTRLDDRDADGFPEYYPRFGSELPYVYLAHHNYVGAFTFDPLWARSKGAPGNPGPAAFPCPRPYLQSRQPSNLPARHLISKNNFAASDKFQILAAGLDNSFGAQLFSREFEQKYLNYQHFTFPQGPYPDKPHLDNVANFAEGTLEDQLP